MIHPTNRGQIVCNLCNFSRQSNPRTSIIHRSKCGGFGTEDYSLIYNISGFELLRHMVQANTRVTPPSSGDAANPFIAGGSKSTESTQPIQPLNHGESSMSIIHNQQGVIQNAGLCVTRMYPNTSQQVPDENLQHCQSPSVDLMTVHTRPQALDTIHMCFMCCEQSNRPHCNLQTTQMLHSRTNLTQTLRLFIDLEATVVNETDKICSECWILLNKYEEAAKSAMQLRHRLQQIIAGREGFRNNRNNRQMAEGNIKLGQKNVYESVEVGGDITDSDTDAAQDVIDLSSDENEG